VLRRTFLTLDKTTATTFGWSALTPAAEPTNSGTPVAFTVDDDKATVTRLGTASLA
jgi:hypothetical protein